MMSLPVFLLARLDEDEERARRALSPGKPYFQVQGWAWWDNDWGGFHLFDEDWWQESGDLAGSPARVLADVEAKRRIVELAVNNNEFPDPYETEKVWEVVLPLLALPYADHPDFRDEWRQA